MSEQRGCWGVGRGCMTREEYFKVDYSGLTAEPEKVWCDVVSGAGAAGEAVKLFFNLMEFVDARKMLLLQ